MANPKPLDDSKVMDVAKPGKSKPLTTSRPVITTHPTLSKTPEEEASKSEAPTDDVIATKAPSALHKVIAPISEDVKPDGEDIEDKPTDEPAEETTEQESSYDSMGSESASVDALADSVASKKQNDKALEEQQKRDTVVQELIDSKKYVVPLAHDSTKMKSSKAPMTIILLLLIVVVVAYALVDLGTIDVGFDVPYHILKK